MRCRMIYDAIPMLFVRAAYGSTLEQVPSMLAISSLMMPPDLIRRAPAHTERVSTQKCVSAYLLSSSAAGCRMTFPLCYSTYRTGVRSSLLADLLSRMRAPALLLPISDALLRIDSTAPARHDWIHWPFCALFVSLRSRWFRKNKRDE